MRRINALRADEESFADTIEKLRASLLKQQYSYNKMAPFFNRVLDAFIKRKNMDKIYSDFVKRSCDKMLRLQTTEYFKVSELPRIISEHMEDGLDLFWVLALCFDSTQF